MREIDANILEFVVQPPVLFQRDTTVFTGKLMGFASFLDEPLRE